MLEMIERLLNEAELPDELSKLSVYGRTLEGLKELLTHLLSHPDTGWQLRRQVRPRHLILLFLGDADFDTNIRFL